MGKEKDDRFNRGARKYIEGAIKAASHPVRDQILRSLKNGPLSAVDLEEMLGQSRYNLYHHLDVLAQTDLVTELDTSGKTKQYKINAPSKPEVAVFLFNEDDLLKNIGIWNKLLQGLEMIEGEKIPHKEKIKEVQVHLKY
jgi:DNA-binding transcriptional ArsR family regulator